MENLSNIVQRFDNEKCCIIIPTYNNEKTLKNVVESVLNYTNNVFVINDGSTDSTADILATFGNEIVAVQYSPNRGKGLALIEGFNQAYKAGYKYAITIDSDGQHLATDLPNFVTKIEEEPDSLIVGARNMDQEHIPGGSTFGHKFSNFWYRVETGVNLPDTQSGYRLYPLEYMVKTKFYSTKYEFEIENIVRASWKGINVTSVPVTVIYQTGEERVSHFRSWDFVRTALLNTVLVTLAFTIYLPHRIIHLFKKKNLKKIYHEQILASHESNQLKAMSVAFGFFMGIVPLWGFQLALAIAGAYYFKLNKAIVILTANISVPPMIPIIIYSSYLVGGLVYENPYSLDFSNEITLSNIHNNAVQYFIGATILSIVFALTMGLITFLGLSIFRKQKVA